MDSYYGIRVRRYGHCLLERVILGGRRSIRYNDTVDDPTKLTVQLEPAVC